VKTRTTINVPEDMLEKARSLAQANETSVSKLAGEWIEDFLENGSDARRPDWAPEFRIQVVIDPEVLAKAKARAKEQGISLRDVVMHHIRNS
jgi:NRPS condensation-like uncharacterized protein